MQIQNKKLIEFNSECIMRYPYYAEFFLRMNLIEEKTLGTMGVNCTTAGFNLYYDPEFIEKLEQTELNYVCIHEIYHLMFAHYKRTKNRDKKISNIAQDMIINTCIDNSFNKKEDANFVVAPKAPFTPLRIPPEYKGEHVFEVVYEWLQNLKDDMKKQKQQQQSGQQQNQQQQSGNGKQNQQSGQGQQQQNQQNGQDQQQQESNSGNGDSKELQQIKKHLEDDDSTGESIDKHMSDEVPENIREQMVNDVVNAIKAKGMYAGHFEEVINKLVKRKKDYLRTIKTHVEALIGINKMETRMRPSRRADFGFCGYIKQINKINVIHDTSGSMHGYHEKVMSYLFKNEIAFRYIQQDAADKPEETLITNSAKLKNVKIKGGGGTVLQPAINYIAEKHYKEPILILSDGYTDRLNFSKIKQKVLILTVAEPLPIAHDNGKVTQIHIEE